MLLCPPFGWEDFCSYRSRKDWAESLAADGYPALRIDLPATGDSGGDPEQPGRMAAWTTAVADAAAWLRGSTGATRIAAIGIGLGGLLACAALADGVAIDDIVLWAVPRRGRTLLRELRAFARLNATEVDAEDAIARPARARAAAAARRLARGRRVHAHGRDRRGARGAGSHQASDPRRRADGR